MSDVKQCDRCDDVFDRNEWAHNRRVDATLKETTKAATAYNPTEYELCETCTFAFVDWVKNYD